jgi:hypothetical protein
MSNQDDAPVNRTLQVRGSISAERLRAVLEKAGREGYTLDIAIAGTTAAAGGAPTAGEDGAEDEG